MFLWQLLVSWIRRRTPTALADSPAAHLPAISVNTEWSVDYAGKAGAAKVNAARTSSDAVLIVQPHESGLHRQKPSERPGSNRPAKLRKYSEDSMKVPVDRGAHRWTRAPKAHDADG